MENQIVVFNLAGEQYGVHISKVESIIKMQAITKLPHAPRYVEGITNLRGRVVPIIDLHRRFDLNDKPSTADDRIIVVNTSGEDIGLVVDEVSEVLTINEQAVEPAPNITTTIDSSFITGIAKIDQRLVILLDLEKVIAIN
jgi:purine-binding chemotaxis protein CheW